MDSDVNDGVNNIIGCVLTVRVIEATGLVAADRSGVSDPYVRITFEQQKKQTKVIKKSLAPVWNETFEFEITNPASTASFEIYDHDLIGAHDFLGAVYIPVAFLLVEVLRDEWHELQPRAFRNDIVSGRLHLHVLAAKQKNSTEDTTGLECQPWINLDKFRLPALKREYHAFRIYFSSTYVDFQDEFKALRADVFPKLKAHCESNGYEFTPVDLRNGLDDRTDQMYLYDPRIARICFEEIEHCRRVSPRVNFFAFLGDRYGCSSLPSTLDKNEFMAIRASVNDDVVADGTDRSRETQQLLENWYVLDENQVPSRFVLRSEFQGIAAFCAAGTDKHNEWIKVSNILFSTLKDKSKQILAPLRQHKYSVSLLEQEITLGLLLPDDAHEHAHCVIRGLANLRVVNPQSARFVDIKSRRCDTLDDGIKEIRVDMIDEERRLRLNDLKLRVREKITTKCRFVQAQWQGLSVTKNHIPEFCSTVLTFLKVSLKQEVMQHKHYARKLAHTILQGKSASVQTILESSCLGGSKFAWQGIMEYLCARSDGSLKPLLLQGGTGCGISTTLAGIHECCAHEIRSPPPSNPTIMSEKTCLVYRHVGHTAESMNGGRLLSGILTELGAIYAVSDQNGMALDINILEGLDLPVADFGGSSDPYAVLTIRNTNSNAVLDKWKAKTTVQKKTLNPQWNERFYFEGLSVDQDLVVSIYDNDLLSSDDLLGRVTIPLSSLTVNKSISLLVPLRLDEEVQKEDSSSPGRCLIIKVMEGEDLLPIGKRMSLDPFVSICTEKSQETRVQTSHKTRTSKPLWNESLILPIPSQDENTLLVEIWDNGGEAGKKGVVGRFTVDLSTLQVGECLDGWYNVQTVGPIKLSDEKMAMGVSAGNGRGRIRLVLSREAESSQVSAATINTDSKINLSAKSSHGVQVAAVKDSVETGPRLRIEITMVSALKSVEQVIGARTWGGPWTYKELTSAFTENRTSGLLMASATKPLVMMIDGLQNLHASDSTCSLQWLPLFLPRNVHMILGYSSDSDLRVLENLLQRKTAIKIIRISNAPTSDDSTSDIGFGGEFARKVLLRTLDKRWPAANLTEVQRASLMVWIGPSCRPLMLRIISELALCIPSSGASIPPPPTSYNAASCIHKAFILLLNFRMQYINHGRIDVKRLWLVLDLLAMVPANAGGLSEDELHKILCDKKQNTVPGFFLAEIFLVIKPFLEVRSVGNRVVYCLQHTMYNLAIMNRPTSVDMFPNNQMTLKNDLISFALNMSEFDHGGSVNVRRLLFLPKLLKESGQNSEFEQMLGDLHQLDLKISCGMLWEVLMDLRIAGPGSMGSLGEILALTEEFAPIFDRRPDLLIQQALNMPDNSMTFKQARLLYSRRKYILFSVYIPNQKTVRKDQEKAEVNINLRTLFPDTSLGKYRKPPTVTPSDELILHQRAMEWKIAKPWLRWCNKPQSREHCKLVFESQLASVTFVLYCNNGSSIISVSLNSILLLWSTVTGEMTQTINFNEMGYKPVTAISLALNEKFLITGGEDGRMCRWDFVSTGNNSSKFSIQSQPTYVVVLHCGRISGLSFLSNDIVVSSGDDKEVRIVETLTGNERASYTPMRMPITAFDCSPEMGDDSGLIATGSLSVVKLWRGSTMDARGSIHSPLQRRISALKFCPRTNVSPAHARLLAVAEWASDVLVWKQEGPKTWSLRWRFVGHTGPVLCLAWASTNDENNCIRLASSGLDCSVCLWSLIPQGCYSSFKSSDVIESVQQGPFDITEKSPIAIIVGHTSSVRCVAFHPLGPGLFAVSSSQDGAVCVWDTNAAVAAATVSSTSQVIRHAGSVASVAMVQREDELLLVSGGADGTAKLWNLLAAKGRGEMMASVEVRHVASLTCVCLTASGRYFLTASADGIIKRWDAQLPYVCSGQVKAHRGGVYQLRAHPIGDYLLSSGKTDGRVTLWDVGSMQDVAILEGPATQPVLQAAFSSDGRMVITADSTMVRLWSVELSREVLSLQVGNGQAWSHADFSSDGRYLVTAAGGLQVTKEEDRGLIVWDASKGLSREGRLTEGTDFNGRAEIVAISISADARYICATFKSRWLHVWHLPTRTCKGSILLAGDPTRALCSGSAWPRIVTADTSGSVYVFEFASPLPPNSDAESPRESESDDDQLPPK